MADWEEVPKRRRLGQGRIQVMIYLDMGMGVGRMGVSTRLNGSATMGARTGAQQLDLEERRAVGSGG